ncbi:MAG: response regulator [Acidobacteriota bacterium]
MSSPGPQAYSVPCFNCQSPFEPLESSWCNCLVSKRTFTCPSCLNCFCKAPPAYKQKFWESAPRALWDRSEAEHSGKFESPENPTPESAIRPLVLVVDDEPDIQKMAVRAILGLGYGVILARSGEEGLELAAKYVPDLVLSDALMPKMDGREMCRRIKEDPSTASAKVVVMTSLYTAARYKAEAYKDFHVDEYLSKPLEIRVLQSVLQKLLT